MHGERGEARNEAVDGAFLNFSRSTRDERDVRAQRPRASRNVGTKSMASLRLMFVHALQGARES